MTDESKELTKTVGRLSIIYGCMFSQKTTELIRRVRQFKCIQYNVLVVNYIEDKRYGEQCIASHDKETEYALCVSNLEEIDVKVRSGEYQVVAIDEGQFFKDLFHYVTMWTDTLPIHVIVAGLDGDSNREPFGDMLRLVPYADSVLRLHAYCSYCLDGTHAIYSKYIGNRIISDEIVIGGASLYRPVCRKHYLHSI
jgi:thymidine kinase